LIVVVEGPGKFIGVKKHTLVIRKKDREQKKLKTVERIAISNVNALVIIGGRKSISLDTIYELARRNKPIIISYRGFRAFIFPPFGSHYEVRIAQYSMDDSKRIAIARELVRNKVQGQKNFLRDINRSANIDEIASAVIELRGIINALNSAEDLSEIRNLEARAADVYWRALKNVWSEYGFDKRRKRFDNPKDVVNKSLNYLYTILASYAAAAISTSSLDPYIGFLHDPSPRRPALVWDLVEPFRPIVDRAVNRALHRKPDNREILLEEFQRGLYKPYIYAGKRMSAIQHMARVVRNIETYLLTGKPFKGFVVT